jgi:hypothetical protein
VRVVLGCADGRERERREILTLGEGFNTQVITLWCFYIVGREILTLGEGFSTQVITLWSMVFLHIIAGARHVRERGCSAVIAACLPDDFLQQLATRAYHRAPRRLGSPTQSPRRARQASAAAS